MKKPIPPERKAIIDAIRAHAESHYSEGGWDTIAECYTDEEISEAIGASKTVRGAMRIMSDIAATIADRESDIRSTIW